MMAPFYLVSNPRNTHLEYPGLARTETRSSLPSCRVTLGPYVRSFRRMLLLRYLVYEDRG
jgi:hypothetical protein